MRYIVPTTITDDMLVSSSLDEDDYTAWNAATAYSDGDRVIRVATHSIYERLVSGTTSTPPESDPTNWVRIGPTNRWAAFDGAVGTRSTDADSISFSISPGVVRGMALLDLDIEGAEITMTVDDETVYSRTILPSQTQEDCGTWYDYFFDAVTRRSAIIITDLPPYAEGVITVTLTGVASVVSIGSCVVGAVYELGSTLQSPRIGIIDYSKKSTDEFGTTSIAERAYSRRMSAEVALPLANVDVATSRLARVRARPVVWIGSTELDSLIVYGFIKDWSVAIPGRVLSICSLEIEGLV